MTNDERANLYEDIQAELGAALKSLRKACKMSPTGHLEADLLRVPIHDIQRAHDFCGQMVTRYRMKPTTEATADTCGRLRRGGGE